MSDERASRPDTRAILGSLKDFQRATVEYVFRQMYEVDPPSRRFLVADEVGLGKTLVARGLVAKIVDRLWDEVDRIDVVYVCANSDIARQNIARLNVQADARVPLASRLTLLPVTLPDISRNHLNFVAFTPGTSFDLRSSEGMRQERALLYHLLRRAWDLRDRKGPFRALQGWVGRYAPWREEVLRYEKWHQIDRGLQERFVAAVAREDEDLRARGLPTLREEFEYVAARLRHLDHAPREVADRRSAVVGRLRETLARTCLAALEPDLVVLDEFQRFRYLLRGDNPVAELARSLFDYRTPRGMDARVLLLSATPYKMYTRHCEGDDDHYRDFMETVAFLQDDPTRTEAFRKTLTHYRSAVFRLAPDTVGELRRAKDAVQHELRRVMVRNERLQVSGETAPMMSDMPTQSATLAQADLEHFAVLDRIAASIGAGDHVEYWKSAPYLINFMEAYTLKRCVREALESDERCAGLRAIAAGRPECFLSWADVEAYNAIDPANARLRALCNNEVKRGWPLLWVPPSLPYYDLAWPYDDPEVRQFTKVLTFSSWKVVPKVVATLASQDAERRMVRQLDEDVGYSELHERRRPLLRFAEQRLVGDSEETTAEPTRRLTGMPVLTLLYPCATLATCVDPLAIAADLRAAGRPTTARSIIDEAAIRLRPLVEPLLAAQDPEESGPADEAWYWSALAQLDGRHHPESTTRWLQARDDKTAWSAMVRTQRDEDSSLFDSHVREFRDHARPRPKLGRPPDDLLEVLARVAVASPAVCVLRSLARLWPDEPVADSVKARAGAARAAMGFRAMYNLPESITLVRGCYLADDADRTPYWRLALLYGLNGNLQATLDEYAHVLKDALGLFDGEAGANCDELASAIADAVSIRTVRLEFDELDPSAVDASAMLRSRTLRCRYAMRFGSDKSDDGSDVTREDQVRQSFNSPFRPFVVATTSIGQEGLDFHWYCHRIYHWNLPANPVDLEQREGRIDRYKGHAIRRNVALRHGGDLLSEAAGRTGVVPDPWRRMFEMARFRPDRDARANELDPWWVYRVPGGASVERFVPLLPLSRDEAVLGALKDSLVAYRLVIGQPRQEDLVEFLQRRMEGADLERAVAECRMDLSAAACTGGDPELEPPGDAPDLAPSGRARPGSAGHAAPR